MVDHSDNREVSMRIRVVLPSSSNYFMWSNIIHINLRGRGLCSFVEENAPMMDSSEAEDHGAMQKRDMALPYFMMSITTSFKAAVTACRGPRKVGQKLKKLYQPVSEDE